MKKHFRKIVVDDVEYKWMYQVDDYDHIYSPYLLIVPAEMPKATLDVYFKANNDWMFNKGFPMTLNGEEVHINLNRPFYVAEMIRQCLKDGFEFKDKSRVGIDGVKVLQELGYEFDI